MTPGARLAAVIELLDEIERQDRPADLVAGSYLKARRYIGAKDRRAISDRVWGILRRRARLDWWLEHEKIQITSRARLLVDMILTDRKTPADIGNEFTAGDRNAGALLPPDWTLLQALKGRDLFHHDMPAWVKGEYPAWLEPRLAASFGDRLAQEMAVLRDEAPVDLRVNTLKTDKNAAIAALAAEGLKAEATRLSPIGLRLPARITLTAQQAFKDGLVEVQDEGSQLLALLTDARPGMAVVDFCAGAGGKTLALAATMENKGRLIACDVNERRAEKAVLRLRRAGVHNVTRRLLESESDKWVKRQSGTFDRVLVDAPCSGAGTWRRNPDAKWRLSEQGLMDLVALQGRILASASRLVRPGGRLIYSTCSLLAEEDMGQVERFLTEHADFRLLPLAQVWGETIGGDCPLSGDVLSLSPAANGTDGFFAAVLERAAAS
ncbi:MAG TPA: RsmB/NOP family class I SAM-dependent RNA methyltransferase [Candidatus Sulfotelmatobacter sp.]|jgi:16S rRNA (cytosine967-C5)-methyltransferase|nr:RsmB/NOP family class I SAM-dependent RNA methyltransferase [Candidatus Sulfotelmatobacter sp.]